MKRLTSVIVIGLLIGATAYAAPTSRIERTLIPETDSTYDLGSSLKRWANIYADNLDATSLTISFLNPGNLNVNGCGLFGTTSTSTICGGADSSFIGGNVGIGTTGPSAKLHVQGSSGLAGSIRAETTGADSSAYVITDNDASVWTFGINGSNSDAWQLSNAFGLSSPKLTVLTGGNVGIGTDTPGAVLNIDKTNIGSTVDFVIDNSDNTNTSSHSKVEIRTGGGSGGDPYLYFVNGVLQYALGIDNSDSDKFKIETGGATIGAGTNLMTITSGGGVGIGTTDPSGKFEVYGSGGVTATLTSASDSANAQLLFRTGATPANRYFLGVDTDDSNKFKISYNAAPGGAGDLFTMTSGGLSGFGTVSPVTTLEVAKDVSAYPTTGTYGQLNLIGDSVETKILSLGYNTTADKGFIQAFIDATGFRDLILNPNGGLLGVRTTNPQKTLHVAGSGRFENDVEFYETDAGNAAVLVDVSSTYGILDVLRGGVTVSRISGADSGSTASFINNGGNFGIGTASPQSKLSVGSTLDATQNYIQLDANTSAPASADCDSDLEAGRMMVQKVGTGTNRLYICTGAADGWDYTVLTD